MKKALIIVTVALIFTALGLLAHGRTTPSPMAQETITGDWTARVKQTDRGTVLWLSLNRNTEARKGRFQMSSHFPLQEFTGLNPNANANVQFTLQREAGTVFFDGLFKDGRGVGEFRFTPNGSFISAMRNLGYDNISTEKLFVMAVHDLSTNFINELKSLGYDKLPIDKLIAMSIHEVNGDFIRRMQAIGYKDIPADKLIAMRIHGVDEKFIKEVEAMGYNNVPFDKLVAMRIHNVNGKYIEELRELGYSNIPLDKLVAMRIHNVDGKFVKEMREQGFKDLSVDDLIKLRIHGVDSNYIRRMRGVR
jgi:hypothetical protein